jgi:hypothetical protein
MARRNAEEAPTARGVTFTFDTGMLIALERRKPRATQALRAIVRRGIVPIVPAVVLQSGGADEAMFARRSSR